MTKTVRLSQNRPDVKTAACCSSSGRHKDKAAAPATIEWARLRSTGQSRYDKTSALRSSITKRKFRNKAGCNDPDFRFVPETGSLKTCEQELSPLEDFANSVTAIGLSRVADRRATVSRRVFWLVVLAAALTFTTYHVTQRISAYLATPIIVKVNPEVGVT